MSPYLIEQLAKDRIDQLHREAEHYRLGRAASRRARGASGSLSPMARQLKPLAAGQGRCLVC